MTEFTLTDGRRFYSCRRNWTRFPDGLALGRISQLAVDSAGRLYVVQRVEPAVLVFDSDGMLAASWHHPLLTTVHGVFATANDHLFITTFDAHQILKFSLNGELLLELGRHNLPAWEEPFNHPTDVAEAADGEIYVSDGYANSRVHRFAADGRHIQSWGSPGAEPGRFACPHAIWVTKDDRVLVVDRDNNRLQLFTRDGELSEVWQGFYRPQDVWGNADGELFVCDLTPRVARLDQDGNFIGAFRNLNSYPHGLWGDKANNIFVADLQPTPSVTKYQVGA